MSWLVEYLQGLRASGSLTLIGGHFAWPGEPDQFAVRSAREILQAQAAIEAPTSACIFIDDIAASAACSAAGCDLSQRVRVGNAQLPGVAAWLTQHLPALEQQARVGDDSWRRWAMDLSQRFDDESGLGFWPEAVALLRPGAVRNLDQVSWLKGVELLTYMVARSALRPLLLARELREHALPALVLERSMLNGASRNLHKLKRDKQSRLQVTDKGDLTRYWVRAYEGHAIELRHEAAAVGGQSATKCSGILSQLFLQACKSRTRAAGERKASVFYIVPCYDRARLNDGVWAFGELYRDLQRWLDVDEVSISAAFYSNPARDELLCDEHVFVSGAECRRSTHQLLCPSARRRRAGQRSKNQLIYADNNATTQVDPAVLRDMVPLLTDVFGNASSAHSLGWRAEAEVAEAARHVADLIGADPDEIFFTSGATESNNWFLRGMCADQARALVTSQGEHKSVLEAARAVEARGQRVEYLPLTAEGGIDYAQLEALELAQGAVVSLMAANNEIHSLLDLDRVGAWCQAQGHLFHSDAAQALGRVPLDVRRMNISAMSLSGHKIHAPKGVGALFVARKLQSALPAEMIGGGQQRNMRSGTLPTPLIVGLGKACAIAREVFFDENARLRRLCEIVLEILNRESVSYRVLGPSDLTQRRPGGLCLAIHGLDATRLCEWVPELALSQGSACNSRGVGSHVLRALALDVAEAKSVVRIGFGRFNTGEEAAIVGNMLAQVVRHGGRAPSSAKEPARVQQRTSAPHETLNQPL